ncbi:MAG TPA: DUF2167 domain-containing protein [Vicinamibacterales bacterium]|nr:DUF2167 domain-containing protein [Vicinamibacterales bacterium]
MLLVLWTSSVGAAAAQEQLPAGWSAGPTVGKLGTQAAVTVPEGYLFLNASATKRFLEENQNIPDGDELGTLIRILPNDEHWFAVFSYEDTGHIDNSERDSLDADGLMQSMKEGNLRANEERKQRGWAPLVLVDWHQRPYYDKATDNLTWATLLASDDGSTINHSVRLLGRTGLMSAQVVAGPGEIGVATTEFNEVLKSYSFNEGHRYAEFRPGDKLAGYGLAALIAGGAGAAAVKTGFLQKMWKALVLGFIALVGAIKKLFSSLGRRGEEAQPVAASAGRTE